MSTYWEDLTAADGALSGVSLQRDAERRIQRRLGASMARHRMRGPALAAFCAAVVVGALSVIALQRVQTPAQLGGLRIAQSSRDFASVPSLEAGEVEIRQGAVTLFDDAAGVQLRVDRPVKLKREPRGVRIVHGEVEFQVSQRPASQPVRMLVSHGEIEVHGTRFDVKQRDDGGEVTLHEGAISFHCSDGRTVRVQIGETLHWPVPPAAPPSAPVVPMPVAAPLDEEVVPLPAPPDPETDWRTHDRLRRAALLLERIPKLRAEGNDLAAVKELEAAMHQDLPSAAREKLSYELGDLLTQLWETERACRQWKDHAWRYPAGKYDDQVQQARAELGCH